MFLILNSSYFGECMMTVTNPAADNGRMEISDCDADTDNDITDNRSDMDVSVHPLSDIYVYMTTSKGQAPFFCEDCDFKTTVHVILQDHMNVYHAYSN